MENVKNYIEREIQTIESTLDSFLSEMKERGIAHTLVWNAEAAIRNELVLFELRGVQNFLNSERSDKEKKDGLEAHRTEYINELTGSNDWFCSSAGATTEGPWRHNSTSAMTNLENIEKANAKRGMIAVLTQVLRLMEKENEK